MQKFRGVNMSDVIQKPEIGKPFTFTMNVGLDDLVGCAGIYALNDMMDNEFWDRYGHEMILCNVDYEPVGITPHEHLITIEVSAGDVDSMD